MGKEILTFGDIEIDIKKILVSKKISSGEKEL